jgi:hypothetical protein
MPLPKFGRKITLLRKNQSNYFFSVVGAFSDFARQRAGSLASDNQITPYIGSQATF